VPKCNCFLYYFKIFLQLEKRKETEKKVVLFAQNCFGYYVAIIYFLVLF